MSKIFVLLLLITTVLLASKEKKQPAKETKKMTIKLDSKTTIDWGEPVIVAVSKVGEKRWGYHQFPALSSSPSGGILLSYSYNEDKVKSYGTPSPTYISHDKGATWLRTKEESSMTLKPHPTMFEVAKGEYLCSPTPKPFNLKAMKLKMPKPLVIKSEGGLDVGGLELYRYDDCPKPVKKYMKEYKAFRWLPGAKAWAQEKIIYDTKDLLVYKYTKGPEASLIPRSWFEHAPVKVGRELFYADYRTKYLKEDGGFDLNWSAFCMSSKDKGRTWHRRGMIAEGTGKVQKLEPVLESTSDGKLISLIRTSPGTTSAKLLLTTSADSGKTWEPVKTLNSFGVFPGLLLLGNGVLVASYGRPGIHFKFSLDGKGLKWTSQHSLIPAQGKWNDLSCGYTGLLALNKNEFLVTYSDFKHKDKNGKIRKAIVVRRVKITVSK